LAKAPLAVHTPVPATYVEVTVPAVAVFKLPAAGVDRVKIAVTFALSTSLITRSIRFNPVFWVYVSAAFKFVALGTSFTAVTVITNVCAALVSTPPFAVPPLSVSTSVIVAVPLAFASAVYVNVPLLATAGPTLKSAAFVLPVTVKLTVCALSFVGPARMAVAHPATVCGPASSLLV
jgi:hypothetical protein